MIFEFYGEPVAKGRARVFKDRAGNIRGVTPTKTRAYEDSIKLQAIEQMKNEPMFDGALLLRVDIFRSFPKSMSKKKRAEALPVTRPDLDNYVKAIKDALSGIVWYDDSQVVSLLARKFYRDKPGVFIEIVNL
uniref:Putative endodeoxyribonuclease n=1 Tax=viral metagenome TaxID=1070528 RepID=A0A6M3LAU0_9ZZZZ